MEIPEEAERKTPMEFNKIPEALWIGETLERKWSLLHKSELNFAHLQLPYHSKKTYVKGDEYLENRGTTSSHWNSIKANYEKVAMSYSNGSKNHSVYLFDKDKRYGNLVREDDERASMEIIKARVIMGCGSQLHMIWASQS